MANLSRSDIEHLAQLARLNLSEEEMERYAEQLTQVVSYVEQLGAVATDGVSAERGVSGRENVLREDVVSAVPSFDREQALGAFPRRSGDFLEVRAVLGDEQGAA
jgi:aspartyl-tRNA(Asn)/glutamyl-tRNA(Gln) amidotransferase subunit C